MRWSQIGKVSLLVACLGCPGRRKQAVPLTPASLDSPRAIVESNGSDPATQSALASIATASTKSVSLRYVALRKLEEGNAPSLSAVAEQIAIAPDTTSDAEFMRTNAVGVLVRSNTESAKAALGRARAKNVQAAVVAARLERSGS